uniref:Uncharacterized protein n=1 Tax=viral metagenome TaxID=1070528 RepID=A0A6C0E0Y6_9ZZZZ
MKHIHLYTIALVLGTVLVLFTVYKKVSTETFDEDPKSNNYSAYKIEDLTLNPQRYLTFLGNVNEAYRKVRPKEKSQICDDRLTEKIQKAVLKEAYSFDVQNLHKDKCVNIATHLCEFTSPEVYLYDNQRAIPKLYANGDAPKNVDLNCYTTNYACCKNSLF